MRRPGIPTLRGCLALLAGCLLLCIAATPAVGADTQVEDRAGQAEYLAGQLRKNPVYISDQVPRAVPLSSAPAYAELAEETGVPTYVILLPDLGAFGERLLGTVHDRLGRDGLYVLLDSSGIGLTAVAFGVDAPAEAASTVVTYELPYDRGALLAFERFVEVVASGSDDAAARAEAAAEKYGSDPGESGDPGDSGEEPEPLYISTTDRENQSFVTGVALGGVPLLILLLVPYVLRLRRRGAAQRAAAGKAGA